MIREFDCHPLNLRQSSHRALQMGVYFDLREVFKDMCPAVAVTLYFLSEALPEPAVRLVSPQSVDRTSTRESGDPGKRPALHGIVVGRPNPYLQKDLLKEVFRVSCIVEHFHDQAS
jgi:hypothetical protein